MYTGIIKDKVYDKKGDDFMILSERLIYDFGDKLLAEEKSNATIEKYIRDVKAFWGFVKNSFVDKAIVLDFKKHLGESFAPASANSMIAAVNAFLKFCNRPDLCVKQFRVQRQTFCAEEKELTKAEYIRLLNAAKSKKNERLYLILQTICGTGIRVSELQYITVEAIQRGEATVDCKGKHRRIFIIPELRKKLLKYIKEQRISGGQVFITRHGKPISRSNIWREMKALCKDAGVSPTKVFPHNLRHLFARTFYGIDKDIAKLADILGHSSINTTRIYIATTSKEHKKRMQNLHLII